MKIIETAQIYVSSNDLFNFDLYYVTPEFVTCAVSYQFI